jgi:hypothetical protein
MLIISHCSYNMESSYYTTPYAASYNSAPYYSTTSAPYYAEPTYMTTYAAPTYSATEQYYNAPAPMSYSASYATVR